MGAGSLRDRGFPCYTRWDAIAAAVFAAGIALHFRFGWWEKPFAVQRRLAEGERVRLEDHIVAGWWWAALLTLVVALVLAATRPFWTVRRPALPDPAKSHPLDRRFLVAALLVLCVATAVRIPRLDLSLYADELYPLRMAISGQWTRNTTGETQFKPADWERTFFENREANNHVLQSVLSRATLDTWRWSTGAERHEFAEVPLRIPPFLASLASIALLGMFCARAFGLRVAVLAMLLCALHPWHVRYSTEARGYGIAFFGASLALVALQSALVRNSRLGWAGVGAGMFIMLASFPGAVYLAVTTNAAAALWFLSRRDLPGVARLVVANAAAACAFLWLYGPSIQQIAAYMQDPRAIAEGVPFAWIRDEAAYFLAGMPWVFEDPAQPALLSLDRFGFAAVAGFWLLAAFLGAGAVRAAARTPAGWLLLAGPLAAGLAIVHCHLAGKLLFPWYLIFALPHVQALIGAGASVMRRGWALPALALAAFALTSAPQLAVVMTHSREPNREVARAVLPGSGERELAGGFWTQAFNYEPRMRQIVTAEDVADLVREAWGSDSVLRIAFGHRQRAVVTIPDALAMVESPELFVLERKFDGMEAAQFQHAVYRLRIGPDEAVLERALEAAREKKRP